MLAEGFIRAYDGPVTKRTSINLDLDLVAEAKEVLGTTETTETVHRALQEVVRQARLRRLVSRRFELEPGELELLRQPRTAGASAPLVKRSRVGAR
jgi:Arc/MetJ family transcription regulator